MAYWWVSQNKTYTEEREGGYLWAPKVDRDGNTQYHWETMLDVRSGDVVFSYFRQQICSIAIAKGDAYDSRRPVEFRD